MRGPSARREVGFVIALAVTGVALVLVVAFAPWYPSVPSAPGVSPSVWQQVVALLGAAGESGTPTP
ncbi:hypothetical protein [Actinoplanes sp. URMC 104]|uniref:hypothetical protein n=1 Tax=Actinoplanes sp. URMC 104 TaxID=3423409 RepID=UPI003F1BE349